MAKLISRARPVLLVVLAVAVAVTFATWRANRAHAEGEAPRLTATEISDGVLFNDGPAAGYLVELNRGPTQWTADLRGVQRAVNEAIEADPAWATHFAEQMQSGDPNLVNEGVTRLGETVRRVLDDRYGPDAVDRAIMEIDRQWVDERLIHAAVYSAQFAFDSGHETWVALDFAVAAEVAVVAVVAAALAVVVVAGRPDLLFSVKAQLAYEILIAKIAVGLRARF